jgi:hypothetical protein
MTQDPPLADFTRRGAGGWLTLSRPARLDYLRHRLDEADGCAG